MTPSDDASPSGVDKEAAIDTHHKNPTAATGGDEWVAAVLRDYLASVVPDEIRLAEERAFPEEWLTAPPTDVTPPTPDVSCETVTDRQSGFHVEPVASSARSTGRALASLVAVVACCSLMWMVTTQPETRSVTAPEAPAVATESADERTDAEWQPVLAVDDEPPANTSREPITVPAGTDRNPETDSDADSGVDPSLLDLDVELFNPDQD